MTGDEPTREPDELLAREVSDALRPVFEDLSQAASAMYEVLGGAEGIAAIVAAKERWEAEHPGLSYGQMCHCLCPRWAPHKCDVHADTVVPMILQDEPVPVPMCRPCARSVR